ncbi:hypothetical protein KTC96_11775 [Clostridium estertheticum]|uniref:hypothetical protein n=1 Tax=Clostridium estertheticum TaxID=238834 RepID=UPI001C7D2425|nr:hypothetical protein [Clostridium estertheticum]MBX4259003.1 hypothetical protein [Clostridium estertheticum]WLC68699.1 hypothetical protein KTC96_11775 [Clostridium estertheticum]
MYDAKKNEHIKDRHMQFNCIGDRSYFCMCNHNNNMINIKASSSPVEIIVKEFS